MKAFLRGYWPFIVIATLLVAWGLTHQASHEDGVKSAGWQKTANELGDDDRSGGWGRP